MRPAGEQRHERGHQREGRDGRSREETHGERSAHRRVHGVAPEQRVEGRESLAPALARDALADRPRQEHQQRERHVVEKELEAAHGVRREPRVERSEVRAVAAPARDERRKSEVHEHRDAEQPGAGAHTDLSGVVLPQEDDEKNDEQREDDAEAQERGDDVGAGLELEGAAVLVLVEEQPPRRLVAHEIDAEVEGDVARRKRRGPGTGRRSRSVCGERSGAPPRTWEPAPPGSFSTRRTRRRPGAAPRPSGRLRSPPAARADGLKGCRR